MLAVQIADAWVETVQPFGDIEKVVQDALQAYAIDQCQQRIQKATAKIASYNQKYHCDYKTFKQSIQNDEGFLDAVEAQNSLWEEDAMEWEYWLEEQQAWLNRLGDISQR